MASIKRNLNIIRLYGTKEQMEETRLLFLELLEEKDGEAHPEISPPQNAGEFWPDLLEDINARLNDRQIKLLEEFLEEMAKEVTSSRERDITLI